MHIFLKKELLQQCSELEYMIHISHLQGRGRDTGILAFFILYQQSGVRELTADMKGVHTVKKVKNHCINGYWLYYL